MMYSQGLKRVIAARSTVAQLLIGSSNRAMVAGLVNNNMKAFSLYNEAQVSSVLTSRHDLFIVNI